MNSWTRVKWTEAGQVIRMLDSDAEPAEGDRALPEKHFDDLRQANRLDEAVFFLGMALPRYETVGWAARAVRDMGEGRPLRRAEADALKATLLWVQDPTEPRRRGAYDAALRARKGGAEHLAAMAAFMSGGSIAPENVDPVQAPKEIAGRLAAGAVLVAAATAPNRLVAINRALDTGEMIARAGLDSKTP